MAKIWSNKGRPNRQEKKREKIVNGVYLYRQTTKEGLFSPLRLAVSNQALLPFQRISFMYFDMNIILL